MALKSSTKDKIRKLLAQSLDDAATDAEAQAFRAKAFELMAREGLSESDIGDNGGDNSGWIEIDVNVPYGKQYANYFSAVVSALHCKSLRDAQQNRVYVFGRRKHLDRIEFLWPTLHTIATGHMLALRGYDATSTRRKRTSFLLGFMVSVSDRLAEADFNYVREHNQQAKSTGAEIDLMADVDAAQNLVTKWLEDNGLTSRTAKSRATYSAADVEAGKNAGNNADLGGSRLDARRAIGS